MLNNIDRFCAERDRLKKEQPGPNKGKVFGGVGGDKQGKDALTGSGLKDHVPSTGRPAYEPGFHLSPGRHVDGGSWAESFIEWSLPNAALVRLGANL
jgi:hypothetical protein